MQLLAAPPAGAESGDVCADVDELEALRERDGIAGLLDDTEPMHSAERDNRISEVA